MISFCYSILTAGITYGLSSQWEMEADFTYVVPTLTIQKTG